MFEFQHPLDETDVKEMQERIKYMNIASHSRGFMLKMKAMTSSDPLERKRLLLAAAKCFSEAISVSPDNRVSLRNHGDTLAALDRPALAEHFIKRTIRIDPNDTNSLLKYGSLPFPLSFLPIPLPSFPFLLPYRSLPFR